MPQPLIKNQYPGAQGQPGVKDCVSCEANGSIRLKTPGVQSVTHQSTGVYNVQLAAPYPTNPIANPIDATAFSLPLEPNAEPVLTSVYVVGNQTIYLYIFAWSNGAPVPFDSRFNLAILELPANAVPPI